ncbi:MAG TPA: Ig-like domain-containing protein [Candidatus Fournierella merdipullorum]|uniref:Ig-like domain-containing protein n=1 Tax=Candidatus Allofournierella merdipullorum TaxID=2838595 RepID=A0A9D2E523_9FIRM|nr:Ig-like domain-containing protein [Candidatus Fournierella merdipullorum]
MKKKALIVVSAAVLSLALSACGAAAQSGSASASTSASSAASSASVATETLTVEELSLHMADGAVQANVTVEPAELAGQLTWKTGDAAIATVDENGVVTPVKEGHTSLLVLAPDGTRGKAMITVWSGPKELTLTADGEVAVGGTVTLTAADETGAAVDAAALAWSSSDETVATVDENGVVTVVAAGEAVITAETAYEIAGSFTVQG